MELQDLIAEFRNQVSDTEVPYLWSDPEVLRYAIDAQDMFVRRIGGIEDVTVAAADVGAPPTRLPDLALTASSPYSSHSQYILRIRSGRLLTVRRDAKFISESGLRNVVVRDYGRTIGLTLDDTDIGDVSYGVLGIRKNYVRWVRVPSAVDTCRLNIYRLPYPRITAQEDDLEVDELHHMHLLLWMKKLAYGKQDAEARDDKKAAEYEAAFDRYCEQARREAERSRYKTRVIQYNDGVAC